MAGLQDIAESAEEAAIEAEKAEVDPSSDTDSTHPSVSFIVLSRILATRRVLFDLVADLATEYIPYKTVIISI